jgi:hydrogenase 3 maturation protease
MNLLPGEWRLFQAQELVDIGFHTHSIPLGLLLAFLSAQTSARTYVLGIQPARLALGAPLSGSVSAAIKELAEIACQPAC